MPLPRGIISVLQTPFDKTGAVDHESLLRLVEDTISAGVAGFLVPAVASEVAYLSESERGEILKAVVTAAQGRVPVIAGASAADPEVCRRLCRQADEAGAAACLIAVPAVCYAAPASIVPFFQNAAADVPLPLVIQDLEFNGPGLKIESMRALADTLPGLAGWKIETVPSGPKYTATREAFGAECHISGGWAVMQLIEALDRGVDAMIPESSIVRIYHAIYEAYVGGRRSDAVQLFRRMLPVIAFTNQEILTSIAFFKRLLHRKGIFLTEVMRWPGFQWDPFNARIADELIELILSIEGLHE
jgi:4-hydroxy-tetrahydrodipicolinate synthase